MSKEDVVFTIGADGRAFAGGLSNAVKQTQSCLRQMGEAFLGLHGVAAGLKSAFAAAMEPITAYGKIEDTQVQLGIMLGNAEAAERLTASLHRVWRPMA